MYRLRVELPGSETFLFALASPRTLIGRSSEAALTLSTEGTSREHAAIDLDNEEAFLVDLGSTNGTRLNGLRVEGRVRLAEGDVIGIGRATLTVLVERADVLPDRTPPPAGASAHLTRSLDRAEAERLAGQDRVLAALHHLTLALRPELDPGVVAQRLVDATVRSLGAERVALVAGDEVLAAAGAESAPPKDVITAAKRNQAVLDKRLIGGVERSLMAAPVALGKDMGLLYADAPNVTWGARELDLLVLVANHAAAIISAARAHRSLEEARDRLAGENAALVVEASRRADDGLLGDSGGMVAVRRTIAKVAQTDTTVLITGESGTGKELVARLVHHQSARRGKPFVAINCAAIPESLIEAELFGIERGVATGVERRAGKFEAAEDGTLLLDEIGELPLPVQAKLLRVLQEREVERVGGKGPIRIEARIVAATNRDLATEVAAGRFRADLYYRLNVVPIRIPPLRDRPVDTPLIADHVLRQVSAAQKKRLQGFTPEAMARLQAYGWPGNVRELENEIERIVTVWEGERRPIGVEDLSDPIRASSAPDAPIVEPVEIGDIKEVAARVTERVEREMILRALAQTGGNRPAAAELLGLTREGLRKKLLRYGIES